jgi:hypothetical protein
LISQHTNYLEGYYVEEVEEVEEVEGQKDQGFTDGGVFKKKVPDI